MAGYEYTVIVGNVGRDPEMRYLQNGTAVCDFSVAVTTRWKDKGSQEQREKTNWYKVVAWRGLGETCNRYVHKGMQIMVTGTATANAYIAQDGQPRASLELTARDVQFLSGSQSNGNQEPDTPPAQPTEDIPF